MKIKEAVVISEELLSKVIDKLHRYGYESLSNELEENNKPLEPIIRNAWGVVDSTLYDYINETDL